MKSVKGWQFILVLSIPLINAIATSTVNYFPSTIFHPGNLRGLIIGIFIFYFLRKKFPLEKNSILILSYLAYLAILVFLSSNIVKSFNDYLKILFSMLMFPVGYVYFKDKEDFRSLTKVLFGVLLFFILDIAVANIFSLGTSDYLEDSIYFGSARVNITKNIIILVFVAPVTLYLKPYRNINFLKTIFIIGLLVALVGIKRSVIITAILGTLIYFYNSPYKANFIKGSVILLFVLITFSTFYIDLFTQRFQAREERIELTEETLEQEGRYNEVFAVWDAWVNGSIKHKLFGSEFLNDRQFFDSQRMLHTDYMIILNGSGAVGLIMWFSVFLLMVKSKNHYYKYIKDDVFFKELNSVFLMLLVAQLFLSVSGTVYSINLRSTLFLFWGASLGVMKQAAYDRVQHNYLNVKQILK